ncbi:hypothetical protein BDV96DRAFT_594062 [Lophiotrema nucula]|uniref:Uncharacterized protein n=1 Tax=Lophiotrema nucula TaxID=690887 RepID=A0A6A5ZTH4_9PLEO|nr:hypothetical protein BDV96DRAFT_594062 [Lophiotrema nucula]
MLDGHPPALHLEIRMQRCQRPARSLRRSYFIVQLPGFLAVGSGPLATAAVDRHHEFETVLYESGASTQGTHPGCTCTHRIAGVSVAPCLWTSHGEVPSGRIHSSHGSSAAGIASRHS